VSLPPLQGLHWRRMGRSPPCVPGAALPAYAALKLCYLSWLKLVSSIMCTRGRYHFSSETFAVLANCGFAAIFATPKFAGLRYLGSIAGEGKRYSSINNGFFEVNNFATEGC
jgi:hypothetical protein